MKTTGTNPDLKILFEDNHLLVVAKPAGVLSQEDITGKPDVLTLAKEYLKKEYNKPGNVFLGLLHRLDKPVGGVMVLAKTSKAASRISEQIRKRKVKKTYFAVVSGDPPENAHLSHILSKNRDTNTVTVQKKNSGDGKKSELIFECIRKKKGLALLKVNLITGRAHQIRVQLAEEGYPIFGDKKYGSESRAAIALYACAFELEHPTLKERLVFQSSPESDEPWSLFSNALPNQPENNP